MEDCTVAKITVTLCALIMILGACSPSPRYTIEGRIGESPPGKSTKESSAQGVPSKEAPPKGTVIIGSASYYADDFHGRKTANGETFDMNGLSAAHKTLPFNTWLEVRNLSNGRTVIVRVNDRGPYVGDRIIDLSLGAAKELHMIETGVQEVEIEILGYGLR